MKQALIIFFSYVVFQGNIRAQDPAAILNSWGQQAGVERLYLHLDRENYIAGQTAWFKAYLSFDQLPDTVSTSLYTELLSDPATILQRKVWPIVASTSRGSFEFPDSLRSGFYLLRAYTRRMQQVDSDLVYLRRIYVFGKERKANTEGNSSLRIEFFPEGGNFVQGVHNNIAFRVTKNGDPVNGTAVLFGGDGKKITDLETYHDGLGLFELTPEAGERYFALFGSDTTKFYLPKTTEKGIVISVLPHPQGQFFELEQNHAEPALRASYIVGQMNNQPVFQQQLNTVPEQVQGLINTTKLHSGILQITVFNKNGYPLAERLCFVNNREYVQEGDIVFDTLNFSPRSRNHFFLKLKDTVIGSVSLSVTDPEYEIEKSRQENIYSRLLISADLPGYIPNASWYFSRDDDSTRQAMDLLMMTHGWRRFKWTALINKSVPAIRYNDPGWISLSGKAYLRATKKPYAQRPLMVMIYNPENKKRVTQITSTDKLGDFLIDSLLFFGKNRILFTDIKGKKSEYIDVVLGEDSLQRLYSFNRPSAQWFQYPIAGPAAAFRNDYDEILKANGLMLENVIVKAVKKTPLEEVDERYAKGPFSRDAEKAIDLVHSDDASAYGNIFDYLATRVNGLNVSADGFDYVVQYRQQATASSLGPIPMTLYLDEVETDASFIAAIPASQVALVKIFSSFTAAAGNAPGGVLAIYTKTGTDFVGRKGPMSFGVYEGYAIEKEFAAPNYSINKDESKRDNRMTLDWRPDIICNYVNPSIPFSFYNNDRTRSFRIIAEGMTNTGKLIYVEKLINAPGK